MTALEEDKHDETCNLCGLPLSQGRVKNDDGDLFCCTGCWNVHTALDDIPTVDEADIQAGVTDDKEAGSDDETPPAGYERLFFRIDGMHCMTCETFIESVAISTDGISNAEASYVTETVQIDYNPEQLTEADLQEVLSTAGYTAYRREDMMAAQRAEDTVFWRLAIGAMLGMWVMIPYIIYIYPVYFSLYSPEMLAFARHQLESARYFYYVLFVFASIILFGIGRPILRGAYVSLKARSPNMDLLVTLAAVSAYFYSTVAVILGQIDIYYDVTVAIVVVVTAGTYYESSMKRKATNLLSELSTAQVNETRLYQSDGSTTEIDVADLETGDRVLIRAGDRIPVDGVVRDGEGTVDEAVVTGESLPVVKQVGDDVVGGSILTNGTVVVDVEEGAISSVDRITDLMWNLQSSNHGIQKLADKLAVIFVPGVVTLAVIAGAAYLLIGAGVTAALLVALTVLLVSCPCALGLATPLAVASGIREAIEHGVVVFDETVFERLRTVDVVVFDKTGTLTTGDLQVLEAAAPDDLLCAAATLEQHSSHPVADAIAGEFGEQTSETDDTGTNSHLKDGIQSDGGSVGESPEDTSLRDPEERHVTDFQSHARGIEGIVDGTPLLVGHPDLFAERGWSVPDALMDRAMDARSAGSLPVVVGRNGTAKGIVTLSDEPRDGWDETVTALSQQGIEIVLLTGDSKRAATIFQEHPHVEQVFAGVPPEAKAETIQRLGADRRVAMVGDGTNDGPALASADLGIALGSGTALAVDAADIAIVDDELASIETIFNLSMAAGQRVRQNIGWAFLYNAIAIPLALLSYLNPLFATVAMASSSLLVVTNSTRGLLDESD